MNYHKLSIILFVSTFLSLEIEANSCISWRELDLLEYISADLIAEIKIIKYENNVSTNSTSCTAKIITKYRASKNFGKQIIIKSINNSGNYTPKSGSMLIWAYKNPDGTYSTNSCTRSFRISTETDFLNHTINSIKSKWKRRKQLLFLRKYKNRSCKIDVFQDGAYIKGRLKRGWPIGLWEITSTNKEVVTKINFKEGEKHGEKTIINSISGKIKGLSFYKYSLKHGLAYKMYENGQIKYQQTFIDGVSNGKEVKYFENGIINYAGINRNGNPDGVWKYYKQNGLLEKEIIYTTREKSTSLASYEKIYKQIEYINYDNFGNKSKIYIHNYDDK